MKKIHKYLGADDERVVCKMENKTWAYHGSLHWEKVDCIKCLDKEFGYKPIAEHKKALKALRKANRFLALIGKPQTGKL